MVITEIRIFLNDRTPETNLRAIAHVNLNDGLVLKRIRIVGAPDGTGELKVLYPSYHLKTQGYRRCFYPSNDESRKKYDDAILDAYKKVLADPSQDTFAFPHGKLPSTYTISDSSIYLHANTDNSTMAKVNLELDNELWLRGMYLMRRKDGTMYLQMPRHRNEDKSYNIYHPFSQEARDMLTDAAMPLYESAVNTAASQQAVPAA